jgi:hypothetical protein
MSRALSVKREGVSNDNNLSLRQALVMANTDEQKS